MSSTQSRFFQRRKLPGIVLNWTAHRQPVSTNRRFDSKNLSSYLNLNCIQKPDVGGQRCPVSVRNYCAVSDGQNQIQIRTLENPPDWKFQILTGRHRTVKPDRSRAVLSADVCWKQWLSILTIWYIIWLDFKYSLAGSTFVNHLCPKNMSKIRHQ